MNPNDATLMYDQPQTPKNNQEPLIISNESQSEAPIATDEQPKSESEQTPAQPPKNQTLKSAGVSAAAVSIATNLFTKNKTIIGAIHVGHIIR